VQRKIRTDVDHTFKESRVHTDACRDELRFSVKLDKNSN